MLTIIHGSDIALSRKFFFEEKQKTKDAILLDSDSINLTDLVQIFEGGGLFGETKYVFIEQLLTKRKKSADLKEILNNLENHASEHTIILWEGKELERGILNSVKKAAVREFKLPQTLFQFLDALQPGSSKSLIRLFHQTINTTEPEMVFFMLIRQLRILLAFTTPLAQKSVPNDAEEIDEVKRLAPWQKSKLERQAHLFEANHLLDLYHILFKIETAQKTGNLTMTLISAIDFFLLEV